MAFVDGTMFAFFNIAEIGAMRAVVPREQLPRAFAAEQARLSTVVLGGPPLGGVLFGIGRSLPFLADAISYVASLVSVTAMRTPFQEARSEPAGRVRAELTEGFRWLWNPAVPAGVRLALRVHAVILGYRVAMIPDRLQGRVNSVARMLAQVGAPLGPLACSSPCSRLARPT